MKSFKEKPCAVCGKLFTPSGPKAKYCSDECRSKVPHKKGTAEALNKKTAVATMILAQSESIETFKTDVFDGVRTVTIDGEKWYIAADVCKVLGIVNQTYAIQNLLKNEKRGFEIETPGGIQKAFIVSKPGVFHLMNNCRDTAVTQPVKERINHEILPAVDRTGMYVGQSMTLEEMFALQAQINLDHKKRLDACDEHLAMHDMRLNSHDTQIADTKQYVRDVEQKVNKVASRQVNAESAYTRFIPSDIAEVYDSSVTPQMINKIFEEFGYQKYDGERKRWKATAKVRSMASPYLVTIEETIPNGTKIPKVWITVSGRIWVENVLKSRGKVPIVSDNTQVFIAC